MRTAIAVALVLETKEMTKYGLAKVLNASPTSVEQWLKGTRMSTRYAAKFEELYGIEINDVYTTVLISGRRRMDGREDFEKERDSVFELGRTYRQDPDGDTDS